MFTIHRTPTLSTVALAAVLTCAAGLGYRHVDAAAMTPLATAPATASLLQDEPGRIDVDFGGGTLLTLLRTLQEDHGVQLVFEPNVELVSLPPIQLKGVRPIVVVQTVHALRPQVRFQTIDPAIVIRLDEHRHRAISPPDGDNAAPAAPQEPTGDGEIAVFDLDFQGGPAIEYVNEIRKVNPRANIVVMPGAEGVNVPSVHLRSVTTTLALQLLNRGVVETDAGTARVRLDILESDHSTESLCIIRHEPIQHVSGPMSGEEARARHQARLAEQQRNQASEIESHVWSVAQPISLGVKADELLSAIEAGLDMLEDEGRTSLRYHPDTQVLMLRGPLASLEFVDGMIDAITSSATTRGG